MCRWIEIRDQIPPLLMTVLFYIRDEIEGYTEDYVKQGWVSKVHVNESYERKIEYSFSEDLSSHETVSHWTLLPESPTPWRT